MNMSNTLIAAVVAILIIGAGFWYYQTAQAPTRTDMPAEMGEAAVGGSDIENSEGNEGGGIDVGVDVSAQSTPSSATITLTDDGFAPQRVTIKQGGTVTWSNQGTGQMWVASAQHPTHTAYSGTTLSTHCAEGASAAFDQCQGGSTYSFTFDKVGTWNYHNHLDASQFGSVVVVE